ncbi:putative disease resistance protein RGA3 [Phragmites australis]|uniref:putative disease resistance protein RGA3 n=1 Tax=Phragmites australis TaxID=29695 RepID=UPI002D767E1A|nr:putative disease resistance protein RGA3 [Phragmites australis]
MTTRNDGVARKMKAQHLHRVHKLEGEDAWILLKNQVVLNESDELEVGGLKDIGTKIVERCDGLPLAIKVLGGLLSNISRTRDAWVDVCNHFAWSIEGIDDDINKAIYLSFEELPSHLKQCFLLCSLFPKDELIRYGDIVQIWIAEGYVHNKPGSKLPEDLGFEYYKELLSRNLLEPKEGSYRQLVCTMHDVVRSFAQYITKDEVVIVSEGQNVNSTLSTPIPAIPQDIGSLIFLQAIDLVGCSNISQLPNSILKLRKLRLLDIRGTNITSVPRGFGKLEDLVILAGFPTNSDDCTDGWCSLEELGSLSKLKLLDITGLEKASSGSMAATAKLYSKHHQTTLTLNFTSRLGDNGEVEENISKEEHEQIEEVLGNLCPPTCIEELTIKGYFGSGLPQWTKMMSPFGTLRKFVLEGYACCKQIPNGLGQLPFLEYFWVEQAPSIQCIGHDFLLPSTGGEGDGKDDTPVITRTRIESRQRHHISHGAAIAFPKLKTLGFEGMLGWTEWDWEQQVPAMTVLEGFLIDNCKLQHLPPGLAHHAGRLMHLDLRNVLHLVSVENFLSLVELKIFDNPRLERITNCPSLQKTTISSCPRLKLLEGLPALGSIQWKDFDAETLPQYLREAKLTKLTIYCSLSLLKLISLQDDTSEWGKIQHVQQLKAYACESEKLDLDGYIYYTKEPYSLVLRPSCMQEQENKL